jgi:hypothetical protein
MVSVKTGSNTEGDIVVMKSKERLEEVSSRPEIPIAHLVISNMSYSVFPLSRSYYLI